MGGNFRFQVQDSFLEFFFRDLEIKKRIALSEKKTPLIWSLLKSTPVYFSRSHNYLSNPINCMIHESMAKCWCWILFQLVIHLSIQSMAKFCHKSMAKFCHNPWLNSAIKKKGPFCLPTPRIHSINKGTKVLAEKSNTKKEEK